MSRRDEDREHLRVEVAAGRLAVEAEEDGLCVRGAFVHVGHAEGLVARQAVRVARRVGEAWEDGESFVGGS
jgi:hypothetical protein